jgi:serine/threonine protein kinase
VHAESSDPHRFLVTELFGETGRLQPDPLLERLRGATAGSYDVVGELGRGGMAVVYAGTDRQLERRVAIKVMDPRLAMTQGMAARFLQEARIAARLQHPNIIVVHDVRQSDEIIFFVMSLIDGIAVDELCRQGDAIPIDQIRWILFQATRALAYAHSEDIIHRDIKPANILLNLKGDVILTDFGIAKALGDTGLTQSGTQVGTPMYMSPEQFSGVPVGPASDQYALGITAYQMIAGRPPFSGDLYQLIAAHGNKKPVPVRELRPDCPAFLANAVMRMLEKNPEDRWPSLEDLQDVFGANMAMDGGLARRKLAETVRALRHSVPGVASGGPSGASDPGPTSGSNESTTMVVTISPPGATIFVSGTLDLRASVALDTGQSLPGAGVQWTSSDVSVLTVQPNGTVSGVSPGTAVVRASVNGGWSEATIRVEAAPIARLSLPTPHVTLRVGDVMRPEVTAVDVNGVACDVAMVWISRAPTVADLDAPGVIRAIAPGMAVIDISVGNVRRSLDVAVLRRPISKLRVTAPTPSLQLGDASSLSFEAFDDLGARSDATPARWTSSAPSVIHVDSTGRALAIAPGVARITASIDEATDSIELESLEPAIGAIHLALSDTRVELGDEVAFTLRVKDINGASRSATGVRVWSSDPSILLIDEPSLRGRALRIGEVTVFAAPDAGAGPESATTSATVVITDVVVTRLELFPATLDLEVGAVAAVNVQAYDRRGVQVLSAPASWQSASPNVAVVEGSGIVRALAPGACTIRAHITSSDGSVADATVSVRVKAASIARLSITSERSMLEVGEVMALRATTWDAMDVEVTDATPAWRSMHPQIARVEGNGRLVALSPGRATITAELEGKSGQLTILVAPSAVDSLRITAPTTDAIVGSPLPLSVLAHDRNGQAVSPTLRWHVEPADAATISATGTLTPLRAGMMVVRASLAAPTDATGLLSAKSPVDASITITARAPRITALQFGTPTVTLNVGRTQRAEVRAVTEDGRTAPPSTVIWSTENASVVQVDEQGELRAVGAGETRIVAMTDSIQSVLTVRVVAPVAAGRKVPPLALAGGAMALVALAWGLWPSGNGAPDIPADANAGAPGSAQSGVAQNGVAQNGVAQTPEAQGASTVQPNAGTGAAPLEPPETAAITRPPENQQSVNPASPGAAPLSRRDSLRLLGIASTNGRSGQPPANSSRGATTPSSKSLTNPSTSTPTSTPASQRGNTAAATASPQSYTTQQTAPPTTTGAPVTEPPAAPTPAPVVEAPSSADVRTIAERLASEVRSGTLRPSGELKQFFDTGADHKVAVGGAPTFTTEQARASGQFELSLSRRNFAGALERRITVVRFEVERRGGGVELVSASFGAFTRPR